MSKTSIRSKLKAETKSITEQINALVKEKEVELLKAAPLAEKVMYFLEDTQRNTLQETFFKDFTHDTHAKSLHVKLAARLKEHNIGFELTERIGGDEEESGSTYFAVWSFGDLTTNEEVFVKFDGYYSSYEGAEMQGFFIAKPVEKTIIEYQKA